MSRRIVVNLAAFAIMAVALAVWAANNVITFDFVTHPYRVTASFTTSPGLSPGFSVTYLGHPIGTIGGVRLDGSQVDVTLKIDRGVSVPSALSAAVRRQSAVGEPYVELEPLPGTDASRGARLTNGDHIAVGHTSVPLAYSDLFNAVNRLVQAVPPQDLTTLVHELAVGLNGRSDSIRQLVVGADQLTTSLASHADELDSTLTDLTELTHVLASRSTAIASSVDNLSALATSLQQSQQSISDLLTKGPTFAGSVADVIARSKNDLGCIIDALGVVGSRLDDATLATELSNLVGSGPQLLAILNDIRDVQPDGPYSRGYLAFDVGQPPPVPVYPKPLTPPTPPPAPVCAPSATAPTGSGQPAPGPGAPAPVAPSPSSSGNASTAPSGTAAPVGAASSTKIFSGGRAGWLLLVVVLAALALAVATRPWRWLTRRRRDEGEV